MKEIILNKNKVAFVDDDLFDELNKFKWRADKQHNTFYAARTIVVNGKNKVIYMHRIILNLTDSNVFVDHKNRNGLDNQKENIRTCTNSENQKNMAHREGCSSIYKGVSFHKRCKKWQSQIIINGKSKHLGYFEIEIEAAKKYNDYAMIHYREFANINNI